MPGMHGNAKFGDLPGTDEQTALTGDGLILGHVTSVDRTPSNAQAASKNVVPPRTFGGTAKRIVGQNFVWLRPGKHLLSVAGTRSGKGVSLILPNLLQWQGAALVIDPKGENAWITAPRRRAMGQKTYILDPWDEVNLRYGEEGVERETIARFNPLSILDPASPSYADDVAYLAEATIIVTPGQGAHFDESARDLVAGLIAYTVEKPETRPEASFNLVRRYLSQSSEFIRALAEDATQLGDDTLASRKLARFTVESRELDSVISTARTQTAFLDSPVLQQSMEASDFSFDELARGSATIYLVLPPDKLDSYARWLRLMISIGLRCITGNRRPPRLPCLFILDELGSVGRLPALARAYSLLAGLGCICWGFLQDLNQLKRDYPSEWETFIGNCQAFTAFGIMDEFTADHVSKMLGTATVSEGVLSSPTSRRLMLPEEVRTLRAGLGVMVSNDQPVLFHKIEYYNDPVFARMARADPRFPAPVVVNEAAKAVLAASWHGSNPPIGVLLYVLAVPCILFALFALAAILLGGNIHAYLSCLVSAALAFGLFKAGKSFYWKSPQEAVKETVA